MGQKCCIYSPLSSATQQLFCTSICVLYMVLPTSLLHSCTCIESHQSAMFIEDLYIFASDVNNNFFFPSIHVVDFRLPFSSVVEFVFNCVPRIRERSIDQCMFVRIMQGCLKNDDESQIKLKRIYLTCVSFFSVFNRNEEKVSVDQ